jgi:hypothetical protein
MFTGKKMFAFALPEENYVNLVKSTVGHFKQQNQFA